MQRPKLVVIVGPTASGKSGLAIEIAQRFNGEVVSADSRQIYRELDIGTAKVTQEEMQGVPHHLIDICDVRETYSAVDFKRDAAAAIGGIVDRGRLPVIAGGTFFYVDTLLGKVSSAPVEPNSELRNELETLPTEALFDTLEAKDPERALTIDPHNRRRLIRALEIVESVGKNPAPEITECPYEVLTIGLDIDKEELRNRFRTRGETWLQQGFKAEVEGLLKSGVNRDRLQEIGFEYSLMLTLIDGDIDETEFLQRFVEKNWQYAKRQMTWLKRNSDIIWVPYNETKPAFELVSTFVQG